LVPTVTLAPVYEVAPSLGVVPLPPPALPLLHADSSVEPAAATVVAMTKFLRERDMADPFS
jgi:hypothetical protein